MNKIYVIYNTINNIKYIGQTAKTLDNRMKHHYSNIKYKQTKLYKAMNKLGKENFYIHLIEEVSEEDADERELYWILRFSKRYPLYNEKISKGKCGGDTLSHHENLNEIKKKLSFEKIKGKNPNASKVKMIDIIDNIEREFDSIKECQEHLDISRHDIISKRCRNIIKKPYQNRYYFVYI